MIISNIATKNETGKLVPEMGFKDHYFISTVSLSSSPASKVQNEKTFL